MKPIIDKEGRLFGKINIVDFSVILLLLISAPAFLHIYGVMGKRPTRNPYEWVRIEAVTFTIPEFAELFKPGDVSYDEFGEPDGRVLKVIRKDDRKIGYEIPVFLELELSCVWSESVGEWYYRHIPLSPTMERAFRFGTDKYGMLCFVMKIYESQTPINK